MICEIEKNKLRKKSIRDIAQGHILYKTDAISYSKPIIFIFSRFVYGILEGCFLVAWAPAWLVE